MADVWEHMLPPPSGSKEHRFHRVAWAVAVTLVRSGPDALRIAEVARRAGVSRAWIYKYLGRDRAALLRFAVGLFAAAFAAPPDAAVARDPAAWRAAIEAGTRDGLSDALAAPWCVLVYVRWRHARGGLGDQLRALEAAEVGRFVDRMPPVLRRDRERAVRFATAFTAARLGVYHQWLDPAVREVLRADDAVAVLMRAADGFLGERGA